MYQDILIFLDDLPSFVPFITAIGAFLTAVFTGLLYWGRHGLPEIVAWAHEADHKDHTSDVVGRYVEFRLPTDTSRSNWLVDEVRIAKPRHKWIAVADEAKRNDFGEFIGHSLGGDWTDRIRYCPPVDSETFLLHPDAPKHLRFSFRVRLRHRFRVKRKVDVITS